MKLFSFKGGVHPPERKEETLYKEIEKVSEPEKVYIPMLQHIGTIVEPIVNIGDYVKRGQKIADANALMAVPIHSSVSGKIIGIENMPFPLSGTVKTIIIENDLKNEEKFYGKIENYKEFNSEELLKEIRDRGIVGQGGAAFPTHIKLNSPKNYIIDTLLLNGAECEPYLNTDNRVMVEYGEKIVEGIKIALYILNINKAIIAIEDNKKEAIENLKKITKNYENIDIAIVKTKYPQGGEKQLIKAVINRVVPSKKLPAEIGVIVLNVQTAKAIYEEIVEGKPLIDRILTVGGKGLLKQTNFEVKIGTPFNKILLECGYNSEVTEKLIMGGPMMGVAQYSEDVPVIKGTSGILALTNEEIRPYEPKNCIKCGRCIEVCPMNLVPLLFANLAEDSEWEKIENNNIFDCIECGTCAYICPANRPLTEAIKIGKAKIRAMKK